MVCSVVDGQVLVPVSTDGNEQRSCPRFAWAYGHWYQIFQSEILHYSTTIGFGRAPLLNQALMASRSFL